MSSSSQYATPVYATGVVFDMIHTIMAKQKKKRNKKYTGSEAKVKQPQVVRVQAVQRSKVGQWWFEKKKFAKPLLIATGIVFVVILLLTELFRIIF
jgi:hypothetical protein